MTIHGARTDGSEGIDPPTPPKTKGAYPQILRDVERRVASASLRALSFDDDIPPDPELAKLNLKEIFSENGANETDARNAKRAERGSSLRTDSEQSNPEAPPRVRSLSVASGNFPPALSKYPAQGRASSLGLSPDWLDFSESSPKSNPERDSGAASGDSLASSSAARSDESSPRSPSRGIRRGLSSAGAAASPLSFPAAPFYPKTISEHEAHAKEDRFLQRTISAPLLKPYQTPPRADSVDSFDSNLELGRLSSSPASPNRPRPHSRASSGDYYSPPRPKRTSDRPRPSSQPYAAPGSPSRPLQRTKSALGLQSFGSPVSKCAITPRSNTFGKGRAVTAPPLDAAGAAPGLRKGLFFPEGVKFTRCLTGDVLPEWITSISGPGKDAFISTTADYEHVGIGVTLPKEGEDFTMNDSQRLITTLSLNDEFEESVQSNGVWFMTIGLGAKIAVPTDRQSATYQKFKEVDGKAQSGLTASTGSREWVAGEEREFFKSDVRSGQIKVYKIEASGRTERWSFAGSKLMPMSEINALSTPDRTGLARQASAIDGGYLDSDDDELLDRFNSI